MLAPVKRLTHSQIVWLSTQRCKKHGHSFLEHWSCYERNPPKDSPLLKKEEQERVGFLDIEAEDLNADYGIIFNWCLLDAQTNKIHRDIITPRDIKKYPSKERNKMPTEDTRIIQSLVKLLGGYDRIIGHYSCRYDVPFVRTRAVMCGVPFPHYGLLYQTDTWVILKNKFKLSRNSLQNSTLKLLGVTRKDHLSLSIKHGCLRGEKWALETSDAHCEKDVLDLRDLYNKIHPFARKTKSSI